MRKLEIADASIMRHGIQQGIVRFEESRHEKETIMKKYLLAATAAVSMFTSALPVLAEERSTDGYATDIEGNILRDSYGNCVHSGTWSPEKATVVGCDGYAIQQEAEFLKGQPIEGGIVQVTFPFAELFAFDKADISDQGKAYMAKEADRLKSSLADAYSITVVGHTDSTGSAAYNNELSKRRANAVADYLMTLGAPKDKIRTLGAGASDPIASNSTAEGQAINRRAEVIIIGQPRALDRMIFPAATLFDSRSADLSPQGQQMLKDNVQKAKEQFKRAVMLEVVGHTDDIDTDEYNQKLSQARAEAVARYLVEAGVSPEKIVTTGAGESAPVANNATPEGRQKNRRVEILVVGRGK